MGARMSSHWPRDGFWRWLLGGYDRRTVLALGAMGLTCLTVAVVYSDLIEWDAPMDWLLVGIWVAMGALLSWRVDPRRDLPLLIVGLIGGGIIEWWGTESVLWIYYTRERPPLWILPAWPISALAIVRIHHLLRRALSPLDRLGWAYWVVVPAFVALMTRFLWVRIHVAASQVVVVLMVLVTVLGAKPRRDLLLFVSGALLGVFLEYWGTSRHCWIYYTLQEPPLEAALAHGFATVAFARGVQGVQWLWGLVRGRRRDLQPAARGTLPCPQRSAATRACPVALAGEAKISLTDPRSTTRPASMTTTCSAALRTAPRS